MFKRLIYGLTMAVAALALIPGHSAHAQSSTFAIAPVYTNKVSKDSGYFDVTAKPGQKVSFAADVTNMSKSTKTIKVKVGDAYTSDAGQVVYDLNGPRDDSAKYRLSTLAGKAQKVTLKAGKTQRVSFTVTVPQSGLRGILLGSLYAIDTGAYGKSSNGSMSVRNKYAMYSAIELRTNTNYVHPDLRLKKVDVGMQTGKAAVLATIQNFEPQLFGKMTVNAKVYQGNSAKPFLTRKVNGYAMAPNSHFNFGLPTNNALVAGKYTIDLTAKSGDRTWHFRRSFTVTQAKANKVNKAASLKVDNTIPWWLIALLVLLIIIILLLIILLLKRRKQDKDENNK